MHSDQPRLDAPGLKTRRNRDGTPRLYWVARSDVVKRGYKPQTVRLHYDIASPSDHPHIEAACKKLQAEMLEWSTGRTRDPLKFNGTMKDLVRCYQIHPASPYHLIKHTTKRTYDELMDKIERAFGERVLRNLGAQDFRRWHEAAAKPRVKKPGEKRMASDGLPRLAKAQNLMRMIRRLFGFGVLAEYPECERLQKIIAQMRFEGPERNRHQLTRTMVEAFVAKAIERKRPSLALATAIQFEAGMRQKDVIGEWLPVPKEETPNGIVLGSRRWANGLTWSDIGERKIVSKITTKTGAPVSFDLRLCPITLSVLEHFERNKIGPIIIDEKMGRPYAGHAFAREWREIADAAGIPAAVKSMHARAGAITEAEDAGASLDDIRSSVGHTDVKMTSRYSRGQVGKTIKVQQARLAKAAEKKQE